MRAKVAVAATCILCLVLIVIGVLSVSQGGWIRVSKSVDLPRGDWRLAEAFERNETGEHFAALLAQEPALATTPSPDGILPLHDAAMRGRADVLDLLLKAGAEVHIDKQLEALLPGFTPLHCAVLGRDVKSVAILIEHGASVDLTTADGETPARLAERKGLRDIVELLRNGEASPR